MTHIEATRLLARAAYRHREDFTDAERVDLLDACALVLDGDEAAKAAEASVHLKTSMQERDRALKAQGQFVELLEGGRQ